MSTTITVTGNITEPIHRRTSAGIPLTTFRIAATSRKFDNEKREWVDTGTSWYSVTAWRALGEHAIDSLQRGDRVIVTGRLRVRDWETDAKKGTSAEIEADALGHDLLWGTTTFQRAGARDRGASAEPDAPWSGVETVDGRGSAEPQWNAPLSSSDDVPVGESRHAALPQTVPAHADDLVDEPTPF